MESGSLERMPSNEPADDSAAAAANYVDIDVADRCCKFLPLGTFENLAAIGLEIQQVLEWVIG